MREYDSAEEEALMPVGFSSCFQHQCVCSTEFTSCISCVSRQNILETNGSGSNCANALATFIALKASKR